MVTERNLRRVEKVVGDLWRIVTINGKLRRIPILKLRRIMENVLSMCRILSETTLSLSDVVILLLQGDRLNA